MNDSLSEFVPAVFWKVLAAMLTVTPTPPIWRCCWAVGDPAAPACPANAWITTAADRSARLTWPSCSAIGGLASERPVGHRNLK